MVTICTGQANGTFELNSQIGLWLQPSLCGFPTFRAPSRVRIIYFLQRPRLYFPSWLLFCWLYTLWNLSTPPIYSEGCRRVYPSWGWIVFSLPVLPSPTCSRLARELWMAHGFICLGERHLFSVLSVWADGGSRRPKRTRVFIWNGAGGTRGFWEASADHVFLWTPWFGDAYWQGLSFLTRNRRERNCGPSELRPSIRRFWVCSKAPGFTDGISSWDTAQRVFK